MSAKKLSTALRAAAAPLGVAIAAVFSSGAAQADAVAQSYLFLNNFTFAANVAVYNPGTCPGPGSGICITGGSDNGDVKATLNGITVGDNANPGLYTGFTLNQATGPNAGSYNPGVAITGSPTGNYAGSYSLIDNGDPFAGGAKAHVDNTVSLNPTGVGSAQSNAGLGATFAITVATGTILSVAFDAEAFLRAFLDPAGMGGSSANASYSWVITIRNSQTNAIAFRWAPDGTVASDGFIRCQGNVICGTETADAFALTDSVQALPFAPSATTGVLSGSFAASTLALNGGSYTVSISHSAFADAQLLPEPSVLSLAGLALLGAGLATRRRRLQAK